MNKILSLILCILWLAHVYSQEGAFNICTQRQLSLEEWKAQIPENFDVFETELPLDITLESDFKALSKNRHEDAYQYASLHYLLNDSIVVKREIKIKARGHFRKDYCAFPPIRLNVKKTDFFIEELRNLEKIKMVTVCREAKVFEQYLIKEYLIYKMYNLLTDKSFRARLVKIKYIDSGRKYKSWDSFAFWIEEAKSVAKRNNAEVVEKNINQEKTNSECMTLSNVFQFMIGNVDYSVFVGQNIKLIEEPGKGSAGCFAIPYDFDYSGMVNPHYALPPKKMGLETVRQRIFLGYCHTEEELQATFDIFRHNKEELFEIIQSCPYLAKSVKKDMSCYLKEFFEIINHQQSADSYFLRPCHELQK